MGKNWSLKISQIVPGDSSKIKPATKPPVIQNNQTGTNPPLNQQPVANKATQDMLTPGKVLTIGSGDTPVFKNLSGKEFATLLRHKLTAQDVFDSIEASLGRQGFNPKVNYSDEQVRAFQARLQSDLIQEFGNILKYMNGDLLK